MKIKTGDNVIVMAGQNQGTIGKVLKVFPRADRLVVEGINLRKRRERSRSAGKPGQVIVAPAPFAAARAMIMCSHCGRGRRTGVRQEGGKKLRVCRTCGHELKS